MKSEFIFIEKSNSFNCDLKLINDDDANRTIGDPGPPGSRTLLGTAPALLHSRSAGEAEEQRPSRESRRIIKWGPPEGAEEHRGGDGEGARASPRRSLSDRIK